MRQTHHRRPSFSRPTERQTPPGGSACLRWQAAQRPAWRGFRRAFRWLWCCTAIRNHRRMRQNALQAVFEWLVWGCLGLVLKTPLWAFYGSFGVSSTPTMRSIAFAHTSLAQNGFSSPLLSVNMGLGTRRGAFHVSTDSKSPPS